MLTIEEALERCLAATLPLRTERVPVGVSAGRVLAEPVVATTPFPHWDNSAMDGYAVVAADLAAGTGATDDCDAPTEDASPGGVTLEVIETIAAGTAPTRVVGPGQASRIMTGAPMPAGADSVVMREHVEVLPGSPERVRIAGAVRQGQHIRRAGEEIAPGDEVLPAGHRMDAAAIGLCAALGFASLPVARRPRVAVVSTGDEVTPVGEPLAPGRIWSSNGPALAAWIEAAGGVPVDCGIAPDDLAGTRAAFQRALDADADLIVSTGGVSVGDFDVVKEAMQGDGDDDRTAMDFWKVRIKPGKPLAFGRIGGVPAFGLPGNPVSCQVGFLQFVRPVIRRSLGDPRPFLPVLPAVMDGAHRKRPGRAELIRVVLRWDGAGGHPVLRAAPAGAQGSGQAGSLARAHGLVMLAHDSAGTEAGAVVPVQVFRWDFAGGSTSGIPADL